MPSVSKAQAKLMNIAAHTAGGYGGVPESVGKEFHNADKIAAKNKKKTIKDMIKDRYRG